MDAYTFHPIAEICSGNRYRFEAPRQAAYAHNEAFVRFLPDSRYAVASEDLVGFDRIWLIFCFHLNLGAGWKPKVRPPVTPDGGRYSLFATRSPHRPNPIGMSCVELRSIGRDGLHIGPCDLLDGTPVLDIKPYLPEADAFPDSRAGWRDRVVPLLWRVSWEPPALEKAGWILDRIGLDLPSFAELQLGCRPFDRRRKRVHSLDAGEGLYAIGCRTWQLPFRADPGTRNIRVTNLLSHYTPEELAEGTSDPYGDKAIHREFLLRFPDSRWPRPVGEAPSL